MDEHVHARRTKRAANVPENRLAPLQKLRHVDRLRRPDILLEDADKFVLSEHWRSPLLKCAILAQIRWRERNWGRTFSAYPRVAWRIQADLGVFEKGPTPEVACGSLKGPTRYPGPAARPVTR
jgi:hypothetical protein